MTDTPAFEARRLIRGAASATLATQAAGQPFASLVTPATAPDLSPLLLLSTLSEHTRQLKAEPRCALLFAGAPAEANPQTAPRVTLTGLAAPVPEAEVPALRARFLARHPYAALYADFGDFALWRIAPGGALLVGGFARASRLRVQDLLPAPDAVESVSAAAAGIIGHMNADHVTVMETIATRLLGAEPGPWRLVGIDTDGADLGWGERVLRLNFKEPATGPEGVRAALIQLEREASGASS